MADQVPAPFPYPRRKFLRGILRTLGRGLIRLLTRTEIQGIKYIPATGPVILAGNHVGNVEPVLMAVFPRRQLEFLGAGDLPFEAGVNIITDLYGFIPVNRGNIDRAALKASMDVLGQGGAIGIFPEGGTWERAESQAHTGVALLSLRSGAPVVPIGFSGTLGALKKAFKFQRPHLVMNVGEPIPTLRVDAGQDVKAAMQAYASDILHQVQALLTSEERASQPAEMLFDLSINPQPEGLDLQSDGARTFARTLFSSVVLDSLKVNLSLPIEELYASLTPERPMKDFIRALDAVSSYLNQNQGFFTYRYGWNAGLAVKQFILELSAALKQALADGQNLDLLANSRITYNDGRVTQDQRHFNLLT